MLELKRIHMHKHKYYLFNYQYVKGAERKKDSSFSSVSVSCHSAAEQGTPPVLNYILHDRLNCECMLPSGGSVWNTSCHLAHLCTRTFTHTHRRQIKPLSPQMKEERE